MVWFTEEPIALGGRDKSSQKLTGFLRMKNRRIPISAAVAGGGLLAAAFLQAAEAAADISGNAFTVDGTTLDPIGGGYNDIIPLFGDAPLLQLGGGNLVLAGPFVDGNFANPQDFEAYNSAGTALGQVDTNPTASNILGIHSAEFTVTGTNPVTSADAGLLPTDGTVYSITNFGSGFENVYEAIPTAGVGPATITDTLVTPLGNVPLSTTFDATKELNPSTPLNGLDTSHGAGLLGPGADLSLHAFTIDGTTFDPANPGVDGFHDVIPLFGIAPILEIGGGDLPSINGIAPPAGYDSTDVLQAYNSGGIGLGQVTVGVNASNILGIDSTQFAVLQDTPAGATDALPAVGTIYSVTDLGAGLENVYEATPNAAGTAASSITDTLVTPLGNIAVPTTYDAIKYLDPTDTFKGVDVGGVSAAAGASANAFTIDGTTLDPGSGGFNEIMPLFGIAPLLEIGGGHITTPPPIFFIPGLNIIPAQQELEVYSAGSNVGSVNTEVDSANILGIDSTQLTVLGNAPTPGIIDSALGNSSGISFSPDAPITENALASALAGSGLTFNGDITAQNVINALGHTPIAGDLGITDPIYSNTGFFNPADVAPGITFNPSDVATVLNSLNTADLPSLGTVYSVTDFGSGFDNVYEAIPNATGTAATSIQDTLVTPLGNIDLSTMFDAIKELNPGDAAAGVVDASGGGVFGTLLGDLFGGATAAGSSDILGGLF